LTVPVALGLVRDDALSPMRLVESLCTAPARIGRIEGGTLREGARANVTVIDPEMRWTVEASGLRSKSCNTPFLGKEVQGAAVLTVVNGQIVYER